MPSSSRPILPIHSRSNRLRLISMSETDETSTETALAEFLFQEIKTYAESDPQGCSWPILVGR